MNTVCGAFKSASCEDGLYFSGLMQRSPACRVGPFGVALSETTCGDKKGNICYQYRVFYLL